MKVIERRLPRSAVLFTSLGDMDQIALNALLEAPQAWISYRRGLPFDVRPDLTGADLRNRNLARRDLSRANLNGANLQDADLRDANLNNANLTDSKLQGANLTGANLIRANLRGANLTRADLDKADLARADLHGAVLIQADLIATDLVGADLTGANLTDASLSEANLMDADLTRANLTNAGLSEANLLDADLTRANLTNASLRRAELRHANLTEADLSGAGLSDARLTDVNLSRADLVGANLSRANLFGSNLAGANLTNAKITATDFTRVKIDPDTVTSTGQTLLNALHVGPRDDRIDSDVVRLQVDLPQDVSPQILVDLTSSVAVVARLASQVGSRLHQDRHGERAFESGSALRVTTDAPSSVITIRRTHYGSPFWADLVENAPAIIQGGSTVVSALVLRKHGQGLLSLLLTLARREERELWLGARVERQRAELEKQRANAASETEKRMKSQSKVTQLQIKAASKDEFMLRVNEAVPNPDLQHVIHEALTGLMPLIGNGLTVITSTEEAEDNQRPATRPRKRS